MIINGLHKHQSHNEIVGTIHQEIQILFIYKFDELKKLWSQGSELMLGTNFFTLPSLKIDLLDHLFIKYDIFVDNVNLPPRGTPIGIVTQFCEHQNMSYISQ